MKTALLVFLGLCFCAASASAQEQVSSSHKVHLSDSTSYWYKWTKEDEQRVGLKPLEKSSHPAHFRITSAGLALEIWRTNTSVEGSLVRWVWDADKTMQSTERIYRQEYALGANQAAAINQLVENSGILQLPSDENIKGWQKGCDGIELIIQCSNNRSYWLKNYWTPSAQSNLAEAVLIQSFYDKALEIANAGVVQKAFEVGIPFPCYTSNNASITCRVVSSAEYWQYRRRASQYKRQMNRSTR